MMRFAGGVALLALIGGCGGGGSGGGAASTPTAPPSQTATSAPSATAVASATAVRTATAPPTSVPTAAPLSVGGPIAMRRLTAAQYRATIADVLGDDIAVGGRIEPDNRRSGLLAVGASFVSVTGAGFEQYEALAHAIAEQALAAPQRDALPPCAAQPDAACVEALVRRVGGRLLRRPLADDEVARRVAAAAPDGDARAALRAALVSLLLSPEFLFRVETAEPDPTEPRRQRLSSAAMATRLSYLLWNTTPDEALLAAAAADELVDTAALTAQVDRLLAAPRLADAARAFFSDLYGFDEIEDGLVRKDPALFPVFSQRLIQDAREQTLRVITAHLLDDDADYRQLFTTRRSFMTRTLGLVYQVPVRTAVGWEPYEFARDDARGGLLTHISLLALRAHPGRSSPTLRGKFVREVLLCTDVPPPPGDIDFSDFAAEGGENRRTARERLTVHVAEAVCAGCHSLMDPIGLALEQLDGIGASRVTENGAVIDPSGELNGVAFDDAIGLGAALAGDPALGPCLVESLYKYAVGRDVDAGERAWLAEVQADLERDGYRLRDVLRRIALSDVFRTTSGARAAELPTATATPAATAAGTPPPTATTRPTDATPRAATPTAAPSATPAAVAFQRLQDEIFTPRCATQFCHSQQTRSGGLVLEAGAAYDALVGAMPTIAAARDAGLLRVDPFAPETSFLLRKLTEPSSRTFGARMPLVGTPLTDADVDLIRAWIAAGAPPS